MMSHEITSIVGSKKSRRRLGRGRGSGLGKTSGKGHKGQRSRAGKNPPITSEGGQMPLQMRLPKFGFRSRIGLVTAEVTLSEIDKVAGDVVDLNSLQAANVISRNIKRARVMLSGEVTRAVTVKGIGVSKGAQAAIEAAGGKIED